MTNPECARLRLYGRSYCHLCDDMLAALLMLRDRHEFSLEQIDVDSDPELVARYDVLVPVLLAADGTELCHHFLDAAKVREYLSAIR